ncbi:MAG TPA: LPS export ABC transporter permease LptF [Steroidobacteraceae bacterium]|nr:LPS export ABC transporter permease LptF [Steroidobacteraceae bacterium]
MRRILDRYILREVVLTWLAVTGVLLVLLLTNQLARVLQRAAENQFPKSVVLELIWLGALQNLTVIMPVGLLLGVVLAYGRLYHDSEMAAALACGVGAKTLYLPVMFLTVAITAVMAWLTLFVAPDAIAKTLSLRKTALQAGQFAPILPGRFRTFGGSDAVVYAEGVEKDGTLTNVFVERTRDGTVEVALAQRARHLVGADGLTHTITLYDGQRFEGIPGSPKFRMMRFAENTIPVQVPKLTDTITATEAEPTRALLASTDLEKRSELHWRVATPVMCIVLTLLAVPLSRLRPREGRYARFLHAVLIYFVYSTILSAGKVWIARGKVPEWLGLWWVHLVVTALALLYIYGPRLLARLRYREVAPDVVPA